MFFDGSFQIKSCKLCRKTQSHLGIVCMILPRKTFILGKTPARFLLMVLYSFWWHLSKVSHQYRGVGGQGGPSLPLPVSCNPGSRPFFVGFLPFAFFRLGNIIQCSVIFPYFSRFSPFWNSYLPPFPLPPPVPLPPPILQGSRPPVSLPPP